MVAHKNRRSEIRRFFYGGGCGGRSKNGSASSAEQRKRVRCLTLYAVTSFGDAALCESPKVRKIGEKYGVFQYRKIKILILLR